MNHNPSNGNCPKTIIGDCGYEKCNPDVHPCTCEKQQQAPQEATVDFHADCPKLACPEHYKDTAGWKDLPPMNDLPQACSPQEATWDKEISAILETQMRARISTSDIRVPAMSSTGLGEKVADLNNFMRHQISLAVAEREKQVWSEVSEYLETHRLNQKDRNGCATATTIIRNDWVTKLQTDLKEILNQK